MRIFAFIDSQNLNLGVRDQGWVLDFARFRVYLRDKYKVEKAYLFIGYIESNRRLYDYLKKSGFILIYKETTRFKRNGKYTYKGNVDAEFVLYSMIHFKSYERAIIVSGDSDFYCLIKYLDKKKKLGAVLIPNEKHYPKILSRFRSRIEFLSLQREKLEKK